MLCHMYKKTHGQLYHSKFWKDGFLLLPKFFSLQEGNKIRNIADELDKLPEEPGKWMIYFEKDTHQNKKRARIENIVNHHPDIKQLVDETITPTLENIYQKKMNLFKDKMNWKKPFGKGFGAHQDQPAWNDFPPSRFVTVAVFGDKSTAQNGCLEFSRGNHNDGILDSKENNPGALSQEQENKLTWEPIETTTRDMLIFDSFAPHRSHSNKTEHSRRIFYFTYHLAEEGDFYDEYIKKKRELLPPDIERGSDKIYQVQNSKYNLANPIE